jgi:hypothetical protein
MCSCVDVQAVAEQIVDEYLVSISSTLNEMDMGILRNKLLNNMDHETLMLYLISQHVNVLPLIKARASCFHNPPYMKPVKFNTSVHNTNIITIPTNNAIPSPSYKNGSHNICQLS